MEQFKQFSIEKQAVINSLLQLRGMLETLGEMEIDVNDDLQKIASAITAVESDVLRIALLGAFSDGKTSVIAAWLGKIMEEHAGKIFLATENAAEPYIDTISSFLVWTEITGDDFPLLPQIYNRYAFYYGALSFPEDSMQSFAAAQKRCLLWGYQPGWMGWLHGQAPDKRSPGHAEKIAYLNQVIALRREIKACLLDGALVHDVKILSENPAVRIKWFRMNGEEHDEPVLSGAVWRNEKRDGAVVVLANLDTCERIGSIEIDLQLYGLKVMPSVYRQLRGNLHGALNKNGKSVIEVPVPALGFALLELSAK